MVTEYLYLVLLLVSLVVVKEKLLVATVGGVVYAVLFHPVLPAPCSAVEEVYTDILATTF